jgi:hypothetical protein
MEPKSKLAAKLARILGEVGKVEKTGHNSFHKYDYVTESSLVWAVRQKLADAGVFVFESTESQAHEIVMSEGPAGSQKASILTTVQTLHTFMDSESGEQFSVKSQGQGSDVGDKGAYKAITGAMKYFLFKNFMIPTEDDPERDETTDERTAGGVARTASTAQRAPAASENKSPARASRGASAGTAEPAKSTEVPREIPDELRAKWRGMKWQEAVVHFGKNKGTPLAKLESASLEWYIAEWQPKPFKGKLSAADIELRAALDVADDEWA